MVEGEEGAEPSHGKAGASESGWGVPHILNDQILRELLQRQHLATRDLSP